MKTDYIIMMVLTILAAIVCLTIILNFSPWIFILAYWVVTLVRNLIVLKREKETSKEVSV